jgi:phospholipid/cholesterol/gamma-HCH transport system substrate-binding protein
MPSAQRVAWAKLRVGIMAIVGMVLVAVLIFLLTGERRFFAKQYVIYTYMDDSAALGTSAPVRINGILAGKVSRIGLSGETNPQRVIKVEMKIDEDMMKNIPVDSMAAISAENVLGTKFINIKRGRSTVAVQDGAEIRSRDTAELEELFQQGATTLAALQGIIKRVDAIVGLVESGQGSIGKLLVDEELYRRMLAIIGEFQQISGALSSPKGTIGRLIYDPALYEDFRKTMGRVDTMVADLEAGRGTAGKFLKDEALYNEAHKTIAELRKTIEDLNAGKGTAGKLLKSEELHNQLRSSLAKVDSIIDKINAGQGTVGQLLVNRQLYDTLNGATGELRDLVKAIREDPKKYLRIKLSLF